MANDDIEAYFWKEEGEEEIVKRNKTKIIFNKSEDEGIGIILMLNPGSCLPKRPEEITKEPKKFNTMYGNLDKDQTQRKVASVVKEAYDNNPPQCYVYIVNLSEKREPDPKKFYERLSEDFDKRSEERANKIIVEIETEINKPNNQIKWIWVAFGKDKRTAKLREKVLNRLTAGPLTKGKLVGIDKLVNCMHPSSSWFYRKSKSGQIPKEIIINEIKNKLNNWGR